MHVEAALAARTYALYTTVVIEARDPCLDAGGTYSLTVTDGTHTANIALLGNYLASTFVASSDGHGGTLVVDPPGGQTNFLAAHA